MEMEGALILILISDYNPKLGLSHPPKPLKPFIYARQAIETNYPAIVGDLDTERPKKSYAKLLVYFRPSFLPFTRKR